MDGELSSLITLGVVVAVPVEAVGVPLQVLIWSVMSVVSQAILLGNVDCVLVLEDWVVEDVAAAALGTGGVQATVEGKASICPPKKKKGLQTWGTLLS